MVLEQRLQTLSSAIGRSSRTFAQALTRQLELLRATTLRVFAEATLYCELQAALDPATWNKIVSQDLDRLAVYGKNWSRDSLSDQSLFTRYSELLSQSDSFRLAVTIAMRASIDRRGTMKEQKLLSF